MSRLDRALRIGVLLMAIAGVGGSLLGHTTVTQLAARYNLRQRTTQFFEQEAAPASVPRVATAPPRYRALCHCLVEPAYCHCTCTACRHAVVRILSLY